MTGLFKDLSIKEQKEFRKAARKDYVPGTSINNIWHPVYRDECKLINKETYGEHATEC